MAQTTQWFVAILSANQFPVLLLHTLLCLPGSHTQRDRLLVNVLVKVPLKDCCPVAVVIHRSLFPADFLFTLKSALTNDHTSATGEASAAATLPPMSSLSLCQ